MSILRAEHIVQRFGGLTAVNDVSFYLDEGEIVGIIGPNGAGKTTLFNCITGINQPTEGKVFLVEKEITGLKPYQITGMGMTRTFQNIRLFSNMTVIENVMVGMHTQLQSGLLGALLHLKSYRTDENLAQERAEELLHITELYEYRYQYATSLPYGLQRRLEIARALAANPRVLLFDEPAAGMNEQETGDLMEFILRLRDMNYTILLIEHDMRLVMNICDRIYVLDHGNLIADGIPETIRKNSQVIEAYLGKEV